MGKIKQGVLGGFSGKVGPVVGSSWKGIAVMKSKPLSVANPRTSGQVTQRNSMSAIVILSQLLLGYVLKPCWDRFAQQMSGYNSFVQKNIACFVDGVFINFDQFMLTMGKMTATLFGSKSWDNATKILTVNWSDDSGSGFRTATDICYAAAYHEDSAKWFIPTITPTRANESVTIQLDDTIVTGESVRFYFGFKRADGTIVSDSTYEAIIL